MLGVIYAECHLCCVPNKSFMLHMAVLNVAMPSVPNKSFMLHVAVLNVVMLNVMVPVTQLCLLFGRVAQQCC